MIDSLVSVGQPLTGLPNLRETKKAPDKAEKEAFEGILEDRKADPPRSEKVTRSDSRAPKEGRPEKKPDKVEARVLKEKSEAPKKKDGQTREQAIEQFMDSFESELGIPATRLVAAIANLSEAEKKAAPEVTAEKVVHGLGLDPEKEQKAQALYAGLLQNLQTVENQKVMPAITARQGNDFFMQRSESQALAGAQKNAKAQNSIDQVTKSFWKREPESLEDRLWSQRLEGKVPESSEGLSEMPMLSSEMIDQQTLLVPEDMQVAVNTGTLKDGLNSQSADLAVLQDQALLAGDQMSALSADQKQLLAGQDLAQMKSLQQLKTKGVPISEMSPHALAAMITKKDRIDGIKNPEMNLLKSQTAVNSVDDEGSLAGLGSALGLQTQSELETQSSLTGQQNDSAMSDQEIIKLKDPSELASLADGADLGLPQRFDSKLLEALGISLPAATVPMPNEAESQVNTQQILNQAKALMAKGGGEVKVQMTPEGMGSVHLKVLMQDGKMQIQMQAESKQTKSALESSLADLKTSLAAQKVSVDNIKVDVVNATSNETAAQNQFLDQHNQRESRQFWNQFNEHFGNQFKRNSFFESPTGRGYKAKEPTPLEPVQASATARPKSVSGKGSGLNLVA